MACLDWQVPFVFLSEQPFQEWEILVASLLCYVDNRGMLIIAHTDWLTFFWIVAGVEGVEVWLGLQHQKVLCCGQVRQRTLTPVAGVRLHYGPDTHKAEQQLWHTSILIGGVMVLRCSVLYLAQAKLCAPSQFCGPGVLSGYYSRVCMFSWWFIK